MNNQKFKLTFDMFSFRPHHHIYIHTQHRLEKNNNYKIPRSFKTENHETALLEITAPVAFVI